MGELMPWTSYRWLQKARKGSRRALRRLIAAGNRGETRAITDLWDFWFEIPDREAWAALSRWRTPHYLNGETRVALGMDADAEHVVGAARREGHPVADTARAAILDGDQSLVDAVCEAAMGDDVLAAFCAEHRLAPSDPHRAAVFYLVTGQHAHYQAVDPDHSLLAVAYQGADETERLRVRAAADGDLVRVLADTVGRGGMVRLSEQEADYLAEAFVARRDWAGLWELVGNLPVLDAVAAVRRFDEPLQDGLFEMLAAADPDALATSHAALTSPWRIEVPGTVSGGAIAPDGRQVVAHTSSSVAVHRFPLGTEPRRWTTEYNTRWLALGDDVLISTRWSPQEPTTEGFTSDGYQQHGGGPCTFHGAVSFATTADGFAALTYTGERRPHLHLLSGSGADFTAYARRDLDVRAELGIPVRFKNRMWTMAVDLESDLIAFAGDGLHLARLTEGGLSLLASASFDAGLQPYVAFTGQGTLVGLEDRKVLRSWRLDGDELRVVAERTISGSTARAVPGANLVAIIEWPDNTRRRLRYLDPETLADLALPRAFGQRDDPTSLVTSPDGTRLAVGHFGYVELLDVGLAALADRPLAATTPADLHWLRARLTDEWTRPATTPFLQVLHACLEHRFGMEVALGGATQLVAHGDDIALGGSS